MKITKEMRKVARDALGRKVDDNEIDGSVNGYDGISTVQLKKKLRAANKQFKAQGGRGVELADQIDEMRIALACRPLLPKKASNKDTITYGQWVKKYDKATKKQGWTLWDADGVIQIQRIDEPEDGDGDLAGDAAAIRLVFEQAAKGDRGCLLALYLDGKRVFTEGSDVDGWEYEKHYLPAGI